MTFSNTEKFCATAEKKEITSEMDKNIDLKNSQSRKRKLSSDGEHPSKVAKHDIDEDTVSAVSFLKCIFMPLMLRMLISYCRARVFPQI